jgi:BirA family biotin operon repressor/biotin-[acetyl-CoA-carboxylase] ligase
MHSGHHLHWGAEALWESLEPLLPGLSIEVLPRCDSTNTRLLERARAVGGDPDAPITRPGELDGQGEPARTPHGRRAGDASPCLLVAEQQTRGRGRRGRDWLSQVGASLTFSLALPLAPVQWGGLSLAVGLALADALDSREPPALGLKWPNDLWLLDGPGRGRKLGGILIETVSVGHQRLVVVGVGLNVAPQLGPGTDALASGYACLQELDPGWSAPRALERVAVPLVRALKRFEREGFAPLVQAYAQRDLLRGQAVSTTGGEGLQGTAQGVDEQGALLLGSAGLHRVLSGEVSVRLAPAGG